MSQLSLNPRQREAVQHGEGPLLVLAGAGSGKTRVLTARIVRLVEERVPAERILAVTFTNKAADEMKERIAGLLGRRPHGLWASTFHALGARLLRREPETGPRDRNFTIYDRDDALRAVKMAMEEADVDPERWSPRSVRARISRAKNALVGPESYGEDQGFDLLGRRVAEVYPAYERVLRRSNALDFDDLLRHPVRMLEDEPSVRERYAERFLHVLVDEYQDTNHAQYRMVRALARGHRNVCVVGDDDQSIYGWRGADLSNILDFERDFPGARVVRLEENYRSTSSILRVANRVIAHNAQRKPKELFTSRGPGHEVEVVRLADEKAEAEWTARRIGRLGGEHAPGEVAVLYRTNAQSRPYEEALRRAEIPYRIVGGVRFYERREIKDVLAYLQLVVNPDDDAAFLRVVNWPRRGIGSVTLERLGEARDPDESLLAAASRAESVPDVPAAGAASLGSFASEIRELAAGAADRSAPEMVRACLERFELRAELASEEDGEERLQNVDELLAGVAEFDPADAAGAGEGATDLELFLQHVALLSDIDRYEHESGAVSLMTLHNAKGLEFPVVFIGGLERGLFPLARAEDSPEAYEEERRLFYVGVTRAMDRLFLTHADRRWRAGSGSEMRPSPFLDELPEEGVVRKRGGRSGRRGERGSGAPGRSRARASGEGDFPWRRGAGAGHASSTNGSGGAEGARVAEDGEDASTGGGLVYDFGDSQVPLELEEGSRIVHPRFGEGTVVGTTGSGRRTKAEIDFDSVGRKKVMVAHADLRPA